MRKLIPTLALATTVAMAGAAFAADTDRNGNPTVSPNTPNAAGTSYSDKSQTAKGTNAIADEKAQAAAEAKHDKKHATKKMKKDDKVASDALALPQGDTAAAGTTSTARSPQ